MSTHRNTQSEPSILVRGREAMQLLACSKRTIELLEKDGRIEAVRLRKNGDRRYRRADILKLAGVTEEPEPEGVLIA